MVRIIGFLTGLAFVGVAGWSLLWGAIAYVSEPPVKPVEYSFQLHPKDVSFASDGPFGRFDRAQLQRGFQVYKEVCAACHGLEYVAFRSLADLGYNEPEIKAIAQQWQIEVPSINPDTGEATTRKATPADHFPNPYANEVAARAANNNAMPPDLSLISKARHDGAAYTYSLLTGYKDAAAYRNEKGEALPADLRPGQGLYFNPYFPNLNLAMPPPIVADGQVTYADGTEATVDQMSRDVSAFLVWTAEPKLENRHRAGWATIIFLLVATGLAYLSYRNIWASQKRKRPLVADQGPLHAEHRTMMRASEGKAGIAGGLDRPS